MKSREIKFHKLTHAQKRIWYTEKINDASPVHNIGGYIDIKGVIQTNKIFNSINILIRNNDNFRLRFKNTKSEPSQYLINYEHEAIDYIDFSGYEEPVSEFEEWLKNETEKIFSIEDSKLYYFAVYKLSEERFGIYLKIHHIISDGWTIGLIEKQICKIYDSLTNNKEIDLGKRVSYLNYVYEEEKYLKTKRFEKNKLYWLEKFKDSPQNSMYLTNVNTKGKRMSFYLDRILTDDIKKHIKKQSYSLNTFFIAIVLIYQFKITGDKDIVIGTPVFNRIGKSEKESMGMFTSTVPVRLKVNGETIIVDLMKHVNREIKKGYINQKYPYNSLISELGLIREGFDSLFKISVNYYNSEFENTIDGKRVELNEFYNGNQSNSLQISVKEFEKNKIKVSFDYKIDEYSKEEIQNTYKALTVIVQQIIHTSQMQVRNVKLLDNKEQNYRFKDFNDNGNRIPNEDVSLLFEYQAKKNPNKIAIEHGKNKISYNELNEKVNQLAHYLKSIGIKENTIVTLIMNQSLEFVISTLALMKIGSIYVPVDKDYPSNRINNILRDSKSEYVLTTSNNDIKVKSKMPILNVDKLNLKDISKENNIRKNQIENLAYIIYTSGSTGNPKGVMVGNKALVNYLWWAKNKYINNEEETMALFSSISFDLTVTSIFLPLISGNKIIVYNSDQESNNSHLLYDILKDNKVSILKLTPAHLNLMKDFANSDSILKKLIVGGDVLEKTLAKSIYNLYKKDIKIFNEYGPTEVTVGCMIHEYNEYDQGVTVPIGKPIYNTDVYIMNSNQEIVPVGTTGELYIGGIGLAKGYLHRTDLTDEKFVQSKYDGSKKLYKTGDRGKYLNNGLIEFVGRIGDQINLNGYRIELKEIESRLKSIRNVKSALVNVRVINNKNILCAYVIAEEETTQQIIKDELSEHLPEYMVPKNIMLLDQLPININGKFDYTLLPEPSKSNNVRENLSNVKEFRLLKALKYVLNLDDISINDNFFNLGGDSISAIQTVAFLKKFDYKVNVKSFLESNTLSDIAENIEVNNKKLFINQEISKGIIEKTPILNWFFDKDLYMENQYNHYVYFEYENIRLKKSYVSKAVNELIKHHDILRANYSKVNNEFYYNENHLRNQIDINYYDMSDKTFINTEQKVKEILETKSSYFDMENDILFEALLVKVSNKRQAILFKAHHTLVDGFSWRIIINDFFNIINQLHSNDNISLPPKTHSYKHWANEIKMYSESITTEEIEYWRGIIDKKMIPFSKIRGNYDTPSILNFEIPEQDTNEIIQKSRDFYNVEVQDILLIALAMSINACTQDKEIIIEVEKHGREKISNDIDISRTVGWFTSMYPLYLEINHDDLRKNIKDLKEQIKSVPRNGFNYGILKDKQKILENKDMYIRFNYLGSIDDQISSMETGNINIVDIEFGLENHKKNELTSLIDIDVSIVKGNLKFKLTFDQKEFKLERIKDLIVQYKKVINQILESFKNITHKEYTPSDFDGSEITQNDLDNLFQ